MDQFTVPQFIEHEPKIVGPLTFKQFLFLGIAVAICFIFYFTTPFFIFIIATIIIMAGGASLAFLKSGGRSLPVVLMHFFNFSIAPKMYLWRQKTGLPPKIIKTALVQKPAEKSSVPTVAGKSRLNALSTQIETKTGEQEES